MALWLRDTAHLVVEEKLCSDGISSWIRQQSLVEFKTQIHWRTALKQWLKENKPGCVAVRTTTSSEENILFIKNIPNKC